MGKTKHNKIALRVPTNYISGKVRKEYQDNERPKNKPGKMFFRLGVDGVYREDQVDGHKSGGRVKRLYSRILRKKLNKESKDIINDRDINENKNNNICNRKRNQSQ